MLNQKEMINEGLKASDALFYSVIQVRIKYAYLVKSVGLLCSSFIDEEVICHLSDAMMR